MVMNTIDAAALKRGFLAAAKELESKKEWINELNVFPVPDGDTGTNMTLTILSAAREVAALQEPDMKDLARAISSGSLRGARGNSGVILSQLLRGFTKEIKECEAIDSLTLANAMVRGTETAYKAVMKPKEGTILTVAKGMSDKASELAPQTEDVLELCRAVIAYGDEVLNKTPDMLPVLKQAGVVDSGGQGLMQVVKGALKGLTGETDASELIESAPAVPVSAQKPAVNHETIDTADIKFGYCTEFIINLEKEFTDEDEAHLKEYLGSIGDSLVVVSDDEVVKIHVHTNHPGLAFEKGLTYGSLSRMKVDNMREEHEERLFKDAQKMAQEQAEEAEVPAEHKTYGFIAVSSGAGLSEIFRGIGADYLIEGGQTMNPSTEDMLNAISKVNADNIFILPNNKNIIMAATQAASMTEDKNIVVIPSKTVPQGITALVNFVPDLSVEENTANMEREMGNVKTGQITYAVRTTCIDGKDIEEGDIMALGDSGLLAVGKDVQETTLAAMAEMIDESAELVTIYYGADVSEEDANALFEKATEKFSGAEIELQAGGQPIYYYMISVE